MSPVPLLVAVILAFLWLLRYRLRGSFLRAYGLFFLILMIFSSNKEYYGIRPNLTESTFSPLSLVRWLLLGWLCWQAWQTVRPTGFRFDLTLSVVSLLLIIIMLLSGLYAEDISYSLMRASSFALLAFAMMKGLVFHLYSSRNAVKFFLLHYYAAWIVLTPFLVLLLSGTGYGVTIIMGQYAGFFGNQNTIGAISAFLTPYVLFHWQVLATTRWRKLVDLGLLGSILVGVWLSGSRNGTACTLLTIVTYLFVVNLQSRLKILAAGSILLMAMVFFPTLQTDLTRFVRKGTDKSTQVKDFRTQLTEERRYEMWTGVWPRFVERSLTGYGFAQSHLLVHQFTNDKEAGRSLHNSYLEIFGDLGLPGLLLLLLLLYQVAIRAMGVVTKPNSQLERQISAVFISGFAAGLLNAFFESWMFSVGNLISLLFWSAVTGLIARTAWAGGVESVREGERLLGARNRVSSEVRV
ncbi:MAG: O-antigen ligase domain-containing protein [Acidobacteria bacterium]|nr:O-antigen ligase domain-containing protein [Acidobacteriota bacterium]